MLCRTVLATLAVTLSATVAEAGIVKFEDEASFLGAVFTPLHENFDGFLSGELITELPSVNILGISGINSAGEPVSQFVTAQADLPFPMLTGLDTSSRPNLFSNDLTPGGNFSTGTITFEFETMMNAVGFFVADGSPLATFRIELFANEVLVAVIHSDAPKMLPDSFLGILSIEGFNRATIGSDLSNDSWGIDDLYTQIIPGPGVLSFLGLVAFAGRRRRR